MLQFVNPTDLYFYEQQNSFQATSNLPHPWISFQIFELCSLVLFLSLDIYIYWQEIFFDYLWHVKRDHFVCFSVYRLNISFKLGEFWVHLILQAIQMRGFWQCWVCPALNLSIQCKPNATDQFVVGRVGNMTPDVEFPSVSLPAEFATCSLPTDRVRYFGSAVDERTRNNQ